MVNRKQHPKSFLTEEEKERIVLAIRKAEEKTSGEIRVYLGHEAKGDVINHAKKVFKKLGMAKTKHRNGILIFLALKNKRFAILGDKGIHEKVSADFWNQIASRLTKHFKEDRFADGIVEAILLAGDKLKAHFPHERHDKNELPNEIGRNL